MSDEGCNGRQVIQDSAARTELGKGFAFLVENRAVVLHAIAEFLHFGAVATKLSRYTGHACAAKAVKHHIARLRVVQDILHDCPMRDFGMVRVGGVDGVGFTLAHVRHERFAVVGLLRVVRRAVAFDELTNPRIRASGVVRRVGHRENILVLTDWETFAIAELRVFKFLREQFQVVLSSCFLAGKLLAETFHRPSGFAGEVEF